MIFYGKSDQYNEPDRAVYYKTHSVFLTPIAVIAGIVGLLTSFTLGWLPFAILLAMTLTGIGRTQLGLGRRGRAAEVLERALEIRRARDKKTDNADMGETLFALARSIVGEDAARARELAGEAREAYAKAGDDHRDELVELRTWLSEQVSGASTDGAD